MRKIVEDGLACEISADEKKLMPVSEFMYTRFALDAPGIDGVKGYRELVSRRKVMDVFRSLVKLVICNLKM